MTKKSIIRKNWISSVELMVKKPVIMMPFFIIAFLECLALELILFSTRKPISFIADPIIRKFYGEAFAHYPYNILALPKLFYNAQVVIYIFAGVFLTAISVNILKNAVTNLPIKRNALMQNASRKYFSFVGLGIILIILMFVLQGVDSFVSMKALRFAAKYAPNFAARFGYLGFSIFLFLTNLLLQIFVISIVPIMVVLKQPLLKAAWGSVVFGFRNFTGIFKLIFLPFLFYLPMMFLKSHSAALAEKTFPEIVVYIILGSIILTVFVDCFVIVCVTRFLMEKRQVSD